MAGGPKIFVVGGKSDDPFWPIVKRGAEVAGKVVSAEGGKIVWLAPQNYDNLGVDAAELILQAIDQKADAIVAPDWVRPRWTRSSRPSTPPGYLSPFITPAAYRPPILSTHRTMSARSITWAAPPGAIPWRRQATRMACA